jgi:hypothetical protein
MTEYSERFETDSVSTWTEFIWYSTGISCGSVEHRNKLRSIGFVAMVFYNSGHYPFYLKLNSTI